MIGKRIAGLALTLCVACALLLGIGYAGSLLPGDKVPAVSLGTAVFADETVVDQKVIPNEKLRQTLQILTNYQKKYPGQDFYADMAGADMNFLPYDTDITVYAPASQYLTDQITTAELADYEGRIILSPYADFGNDDLAGINLAKGATEVVLPAGLTSIKGMTFYEMKSLVKVVMPVAVTSIGNNAFEKCKSLEKIYVYTSSPAETEAFEESVLDLRNVETIGSYAFMNCAGVLGIDLRQAEQEEKGTSIGSYAFSHCTNLQSARIPKGSLGISIFASCLRLSQVEFDDSHKVIPDDMFQNVIPEGGMTVHFPKALEEIGAHAFDGSILGETNLCDSDIDSGGETPFCANLEKIGESAFLGASIGWECDFSKFKNLTTFCTQSFSGANFTKYGSFTLPESIVSEVVPQDATQTMGLLVFYGATGLESINIPDSMEFIPEGTFMFCYDLKEVRVSEKSNVEGIGAHAFDMCGHLQNTEFLLNMKKLKTIGDCAFARCIPLNEDMEDAEAGLKSITIPDSVTTIGVSAFENDFRVETADFGEGSIEKIPDRLLICEDKNGPTWKDVSLEDRTINKTHVFAFATGQNFGPIRRAYSGYGDISKLSQLHSVHLPSNVKIDNGKKVYKGVESIGKEAFYGNSSLAVMYVDPKDNTEQGGLHFSEELTKIGDSAFRKCSKKTGEDPVTVGIRYVFLPDSVATLGQYAFADDFSLVRVVLPPENLTVIPAHCFDGCGVKVGEEYYGLEGISNLRNIHEIQEYAFHNCFCLEGKFSSLTGALSEFTFRNTLTAVGRYAFSGTGIEAMTNLSDSGIKIIQQNTFENCRNLEAVWCPDTLTEVGANAFKDCPKLHQINFPVSATLHADMLTNDTQAGLTLAATLGGYRDTSYPVPLGESQEMSVSFPANACARYNSEDMYQVDPKDPTNRVKLEQGDGGWYSIPDGFYSIKHSGNEYLILGGAAAQDTAVQIESTVLFNKSGYRRITVDCPIAVRNIHATTIEYDSTKFKVAGKAAGVVVESGDESVLYVDRKNIGKTLTLAAWARAEEEAEHIQGMITDPATWTVIEGSSLEAAGEPTKKTGKEQCTTTAEFQVKDVGTSTVEVAFDNKDGNKTSKTLKVAVIDAIDAIDFAVRSIGWTHINPTALTMPVGQEDQLGAKPNYPNENDERDGVRFTTSDKTVVSIDEKTGAFKALKTGKATITVGTLSNSTSRSITVTVKATEAVIEPMFVDIEGPFNGDGKGFVYTGEAATFTAKALPDYAAGDLSWAITDNDPEKAVNFDDSTGSAILSGKPSKENKTVTIKATAVNGGKSKSLDVVVLARATDIILREAAAEIDVDGVGTLRLSSDPSQTGGVIRTPETSWADVNFVSKDPDILALSKDKKSYGGYITLTGEKPTLYYKGLKEGKTSIIASIGEGINQKTVELPVTVVGGAITSLSCINSPLSILEGRDATVELKRTPENSTETVRFESSNENIAKVDESGKVSAIAPGTARITVRSALKNKSTTCQVIVRSKASSLTYKGAAPAVAVDAGGSIRLTSDAKAEKGFVRGPETSDEEVIFTSSDPAILALGTSSGKCTEEEVTLGGSSATLYYKGLKAGTVTITAKSMSGLTASTTITVVAEPVTKLEAEKSFSTMVKGTTMPMPVNITPASSAEKLIYTSSDPSVATVDEAGNITVIGKGTARITAKSQINNRSCSIEVNVLEGTHAVTFAEEPLTIAAGDPRAMSLRSANSSEGASGIVRLPEDNWQDVTVTSSNASVLTVGSTKDNCSQGSVKLTGKSATLYYKGLKDGTVTLTAATESGKTAKLQVTVVKQPITELVCKNPDVIMLRTAKLKMKVTWKPTNTTEKLRYESEDKNIATVSASGYIKARKAGTVRIRAWSPVNNRSVTCNVKVLKKGETVTLGTRIYKANKGASVSFAGTTSDGKTLKIPATVKISGKKYKVTGIAAKACRGKTTLRKVVVGSNVTSIGGKAFNNCPELRYVQIVSKKVKKINKAAFKGDKVGMTFYLTKSKYGKYKKLLVKSGVPKKTKYRKK